MLNYTTTKPAGRPGIQSTVSFYKTRGNDASFEINELLINDPGQLRGHRQADQKRHTIIWIQEGWGHLLIDMHQYHFHGSSIFYLEPGQLYRLGPQTKAEGYHITFSESFLDMSEMFIGLSGAAPCCQPRFFNCANCGATMIDALQDLVQEMIEECAINDLLGPEVLRGLLGIFMVHLARHCNINKAYTGANHDDQLAKRFLNLLNENVYARKMVSDYANELAITANYLNQVMKRYTGFTASQHIQQFTILEAKRSALYFGTTMKETAYYLGFDDLAHFSKYFKKNAGTSFREFNNQMKRSSTSTDAFKKQKANNLCMTNLLV